MAKPPHHTIHKFTISGPSRVPYRILSVLPDAGGCSYYRHALPVAHVQAALAARGIELEAVAAFSSEKTHDAYVFSRSYAPRAFPAILALREQGAKIIWDLDDDLPTVPDWSPAKRAFDRTEIDFLSCYLGLASAVTCSTAHLALSTASHFPQTKGKLVVLENLIDPRPYENWPGGQHERDTPFRVLFAGSKTHSGDIAEIEELVRWIMDSGWTDATTMTWYGYCPDSYRLAHPRRSCYIAPGDKNSYEPTLNLIAPHVGLAPLSDCHFNKCKSAIKWMEYTLAGAAVIASDRPPYSDVIENGATGHLCSHPGKWVDALEDLRSGWWERVNLDARQVVRSEFSWTSDSLRRRAWLDFYSAIPDIAAA